MSEFNLLRTGRFLGLVLGLMASSAFVFAADDKDIPPWMENVDNSGRSTYLVPAGAKRKVFGSQVIIETPNEYVARRLYEMEEYLNGQFARIDEAQEKFLKELETLQQEVERLEQRDRFSADIENLTNAVKELDTFKKTAEKTILRLEESEAALDLSTDASEGSQESEKSLP